MKIEVYFHNNFQLLRGFEMLAPELEKIGWRELAGELKVYAQLLKRMLFKALDDKKREIGGVPYCLSQKELIADFQSTRENRFANYRYYLEMLESGYLSRADALTVIGYRENRNGEYHSLTHFTRSTGVKECDNWPVASYARALLEYGEKERFMRLFRSHLFNYISDDTFTAYEQVANGGDPRLSQMPGCVPVQLVLPRLYAWSWYYKKWDGSEVRWNGPDFPL